MAAGALIKPEAFDRADIIDAELGWPRGLAIGRLAKLWSHAQGGGGKSTIKRRLIIDWTCVEPEAADRFLELCCKVAMDEEDDHIHFLELRGEDRYFIVGNPQHLEKIATFKERASAAGKRSGEVRAKKAAANRAERTPSSASSELQVQLQAEAELAPSSTQIEPSSSSSSSSSSFPDSESALRAECPDSPPARQDAPPGKRVLSFTEWDMKAAVWLQKAIVLANPDARRVRRADLGKWADEFRLMRERDHLGEEAITNALVWTFEADPDPFWRSQVQSAAGFRQKWDQLTARMNNPKQQGGGFR